jgi:CRISPR system Cascade subunit CasA
VSPGVRAGCLDQQGLGAVGLTGQFIEILEKPRTGAVEIERVRDRRKRRHERLRRRWFLPSFVPGGKAPTVADLPLVFPWLAPTRSADRFPTTLADAHPLQVFWGMPRRIRLVFAENVDSDPCDLTGGVDPVVVTGWRQLKNGVKYVAWDHPLSPSYKDMKTGGWIAQLAKAGIGYRDWVAIAFGNAGAETRRPARCITNWRARSVDVRQLSRLLATGYHMVNNMKARAFVESEMPLPGSDPKAADTLAKVARRLVDAAGIAAATLRSAVRQARFSRDTNVDSAPLAAVYESFWVATQDRFFDLLPDKPSGDWETALDAAASPWHAVLKSTALRLFDEAAPLDPSAVSYNPRRIVEARRNLFGTLDGWGPMGSRLFEALQLASPEPKGKRRRQSASMEPA